MVRLQDGNTGKAPLVLYQNVTGTLHGQWVRSQAQESLVPPNLNLTEYAPLGPFGPLPISGFSKNVTGAAGSLKVWSCRI